MPEYSESLSCDPADHALPGAAVQYAYEPITQIPDFEPWVMCTVCFRAYPMYLTREFRMGPICDFCRPDP